MSKRPKTKIAEGIYERDGRLMIAYDLGPDPITGRRRQRWETLPKGTTRTDARRYRRQKLTDIERGIRPDPRRIKLGEYLTDWLERFRAEHPETRTWYGWRGHFQKHLIPVAGDIRLARLDRATIAAAYAKIAAGWTRDDGTAVPAAPRMVGYVHAALARALEDAVRDGLIAQNWARGATKPAKPDVAKNAVENCWSADELSRFLEAARADELLGYALWRTLAMTGVRTGELLGFAPDDLDLDAGRLTVRRQYALADGKPRRRAPKTRASRRTIDLDPETVAALRAYLKSRREHQIMFGWRDDADAYLFCRPDATPVHPRAFSNRFARLVAAADVKRITPHGVRHTHATLMLRQGRSIPYVAQRLGHRPEVLLSVYAHVLEQDGREAARAFAELVDG